MSDRPPPPNDIDPPVYPEIPESRLVEPIETPVWELRDHGTPDGIAELMGAVAEARLEFGTPRRTKSTTVYPKQGRPYSFEWAPLAEIYAAVDKPLAKHGVSLWQPVTGPDPDGYFRVTTRLRHGSAYTEAIVKFRDASSMQDLGGRISYMRRYAVNAILALDADGDLDEAPIDHGKGEGPNREPPGPPQPTQAAPGKPKSGKGKPKPQPKPQPKQEPPKTLVDEKPAATEAPPTRPVNEKPQAPESGLSDETRSLITAQFKRAGFANKVKWGNYVFEVTGKALEECTESDARTLLDNMAERQDGWAA